MYKQLTHLLTLDLPLGLSPHGHGVVCERESVVDLISSRSRLRRFSPLSPRNTVPLILVFSPFPVGPLYWPFSSLVSRHSVQEGFCFSCVSIQSREGSLGWWMRCEGLNKTQPGKNQGYSGAYGIEQVPEKNGEGGIYFCPGPRISM